MLSTLLSGGLIRSVSFCELKLNRMDQKMVDTYLVDGPGEEFVWKTRYEFSVIS